jgi:hypothetical protein
MADAIVIDCGGSTRIKKMEKASAGNPPGVGDMPSLLKVMTLNPGDLPPGVLIPPPPTAFGSQHDVNVTPGKAPYASMSLAFQDSQGSPFVISVLPFPSNFVIKSILNQSVSGEFKNGNMTVTVSIFSTDVDPLVEARQHRDSHKDHRRRYIVSNAAAISQVFKNSSAGTPGGTLIFDASNPAAAAGAVGTAPGAVPAPGAALYVSVVLS